IFQSLLNNVLRKPVVCHSLCVEGSEIATIWSMFSLRKNCRHWKIPKTTASKRRDIKEIRPFFVHSTSGSSEIMLSQNENIDVTLQQLSPLNSDK
ncbi:MAG: hypothetical protein K8R90_12050, partial [Candidatus Cloacimonetes bacterium]|nr:hypothetical protein [Candidatus Cloacimonadota bacterium]